MSLDADLEIGLVWDRTRQGFKVSLRFDVPGTNTDDWLAAEQLLVLDLPRLESLRVSPSSYAEALSEMVMGDTTTSRLTTSVLALGSTHGRRTCTCDCTSVRRRRCMPFGGNASTTRAPEPPSQPKTASCCPAT
jgi:hypothetical protein